MDDTRTNSFQERALAISIPGLENVASNINWGLSKLIEQLKTGDKLFESPVVSQWAAFVSVRSNDPGEAMFAKLSSLYTDDVLAKMLAGAKEVDNTKEFAKKIEGAQIAHWIQAGNNVDDVYKILKLNQAGDKLFENPLFVSWAAFVVKKNSKDPGSEMFTTFTKYYDDDVLATMIPTRLLISAKKVDSTRAKATELEELQIALWISTDKSADDVFRLLNLDKTGDKLFESPVWPSWINFIKQTKTKPDEATVTELTKIFGDVNLAKMISTATKVDSTEKLAVDLRSVQFKNWLTDGKTPKDVNTMLKLGTDSDDVTKAVSLSYDKFYGKIKVGDITIRAKTPALEKTPTRGSIRING
ncbi:RxLR effector protein [Phytophthora megakarya]|uniref:RxLR effector protein n=1 Tax=Phytophthora megakarya TaxID=4795 RepID=A0A225UUR2_9STRA|nr:RxLR effector protein [Phytophthora megakarya]